MYGLFSQLTLLESQCDTYSAQSTFLEALWELQSAQSLMFAGGSIGCTFCSVPQLAGGSKG